MNSDKAEGRAVAARKKAALVAAKKLDAAADAVSAFALACAMCADASSPVETTTAVVCSRRTCASTRAT